MLYPGHGAGGVDDDVDLAALKAKYSRPRAELERELQQTEMGMRGAAAKQGSSMQQSYDKLTDIVMCGNCQAMGTIKKQYGFRVMDEQCSVCDGEGVIRKGQAKLASAELRAKVKRVEAMVGECEDLDELERLEEALKKRTPQALDAVLPKAPEAPPALVDEEEEEEAPTKEAAADSATEQAVEVA